VFVNTSLSSWLMIILALCAASLPFVNERLFAVISVEKFLVKPFWVRLIELLVLYFALGSLGFFLESNVGNRFEQKWEFYAITACLFVVLAFPGFVFRYLRK
jgi:Na+(H+)/acetate symporter ActP